jgi:pSer/pThr/pTyr-binding forkhead associated (FHA) protein
MLAYLELISPLDKDSNLPKNISLTSDSSTTVMGRGSATVPVTVRISLQDQHHQEVISRKHVCILYDLTTRQHVVVDEKSLNGVAVNQVRISKSYLKHGDVVQLGGASHVDVGRTLISNDLSVRYKYCRQKQIPLKFNDDKSSGVTSSSKVEEMKTSTTDDRDIQQNTTVSSTSASARDVVSSMEAIASAPSQISSSSSSSSSSAVNSSSHSSIRHDVSTQHHGASSNDTIPLGSLKSHLNCALCRYNTCILLYYYYCSYNMHYVVYC